MRLWVIRLMVPSEGSTDIVSLYSVTLFLPFQQNFYFFLKIIEQRVGDRNNKEGEQCRDKHATKGCPSHSGSHFTLMNHLPFLNPRKSDLRKPLKFYTSHQTSMGPLYVAIHQPI